MTKSVYVEGNDSSLVKMFSEEGWKISDDLFSSDLLCLEGGADVTPAIYNEENISSYNNPDKDTLSFGLIALAVKLDIPIVGICRGHQVLAVYHGASLIQDIKGHNNCVHQVEHLGIRYEVISDHHQSVRDAWAYCVDCCFSEEGVCEVMEYLGNGYRHLGVQFHPEWANKGHESRELFFKLLGEIV